MQVDFRIHDLAPDSAWLAKYAGITDEEAVSLITTKVEKILKLQPSKDLVVFEGNPLQFGATVVTSFHADKAGKLEVSSCYPGEQ